MAKVSPILRAFNAGEFSELMQGRSDIDRFQASLRSAVNFMATPQGPVIRRPGTEYVTRVQNEGVRSELIEFTFSNTQSYVLEFGHYRVRFLNENGLLVRDAMPVTGVSIVGGALTLTSVLGYAVFTGDDFVLQGWSAASGLNGIVAHIASKVIAGSVVTYTLALPAGTAPSVDAPAPTAYPVYTVESPYSYVDAMTLRAVQSADVLYLFNETLRPQKLSRYDTYFWVFDEVAFNDGPFLPTNTTGTRFDPSSTGGVSYTARVRSDASAQEATETMTFADPVVVTGYTIYLEDVNNADATYSALDYAPSTWTLQVNDGGTWRTIDRKVGYVLYENLKSVFFEIGNDIAADEIRIVMTACRRNGPIEPKFSKILFAVEDGRNISVTASSANGINGDAGFSGLDVGRGVRIKGSDGTWTWGTIYAVAGTTDFSMTVQGPPLRDSSPVSEWRLGSFSHRTGWPTCGTFFEDRLWLGGVENNPDLIVASVSSAYETFSQTDGTGQVLDDSAIVVNLNARKLGRVAWMSSDERGLVIGTEAGEHIIRGNDNEAAVTPRNIKARMSTSKGSARIEAVKVDRQLLFVQRSRKNLRELAYVFEADGYKSPSMTQFASHLSTSRFAELAYAAEPYPSIWVRRDNGTLVSLTYNRDENVVGWYTHDLAGGIVESMAVLPSSTGTDDVLWLTVLRNGRRNIERLTRAWDFDLTLANAHFVDAGLRYTGAATTTLSGLQHLAGQVVYGLADGSPIGPLTVAANGSLALPYAASNVVVGLGYKSRAVTHRIEAGAQDGTAQGKIKRVASVMIRLWASVGGRIGPYMEEHGVPEVLDTMTHRYSDSNTGAVPLTTGDFGPVAFTGHYERSGSLVFEQPANVPLPFNLVAIMPDLTTVDA